MNKQQIVDYTPIGEIKFVPKTITPFGYIEYVEGDTFSSGTYPELFKVLQTNTFPPLLNKQPTSTIPLGTMIYSLSYSAPPSGYKIWEYNPGNLEGTDILPLFEEIYRRLPYSDDTRTIWREAIDNRTFPRLPKNFFIRALQTGTLFDLGSYKPEALNANAFDVARFSLPATVMPTNEAHLRDNAINNNTLTPLSEAIKKLSDVVTNKQVYIYGVRPSVYEDRNPTFTSVDNSVYQYSPIKADVNVSDETVPNSLHCTILVKVNNDNEKVLEDSFKPVIRAYHSIDVPLQNVELALSTMTKVYEETHENVEAFKNKISDIQNKIETLDTSILPQKIQTLVDSAKEILSELINEERVKLSDISLDFDSKLQNEIKTFREAGDEVKDSIRKKYDELYDSLCCIFTQIKKYSIPILDKIDILHVDSRTLIKKTIRDTFDEWSTELYEDITQKIKKNKDETNETINKLEQETENKLIELREEINAYKEEINVYKEETNTHLSTIDSRLDSIENSIRALEERLANKIPAITQKVPGIKEQSIISTRYFGTGDEYLGTPNKWCVIDNETNLAFPAYVIEE